MTTVVYGDILFILNAYITDLLLLLCDLLCREKSRRGRRAAASLLGGGYAFVILIPHLPRAALVLSRLPMAAVLLLAAHGFVSRGRFVRLYLGFFLVNFVFAGLMGALWHTLHPRGMLYYGAVVYFGIDTLTLVVLTVVCYAVLWCADRLLQTRRNRQSIYSLTVAVAGKQVRCRAFLDTGNVLREPFSGYPVVLLQERLVSSLNMETAEDTARCAALQQRVIPCESPGGSSLLHGFRPTKLTIEAVQGRWETDEVYVAPIALPILNGDCGALLHPALLEAQPVNERSVCR